MRWEDLILIKALCGSGAAAVEFFQDTNPGYLKFGSPDAPGNVAEWIVDLVVKVRAHSFTMHMRLCSLCGTLCGTFKECLVV